MGKFWKDLKRRLAREIIQYALDRLTINQNVVDEIQKRTKLPHAVVRLIVEIVFDSIVRALNDALEQYGDKNAEEKKQ